MESLANNKFSQLTSDEMNSIEGGWGWKLMSIGYVKLEGADFGTSTLKFQYHNIFGNPVDGKYREELD
ncbi:MAG TPA: bacteriocin [Tenuifilaceae bacterium]|nr:bacteriocin [Tenuifilaceae bacterium]HQB77514.1 bacteriocin [Tenuifilaceae bacterium]